MCTECAIYIYMSTTFMFKGFLSFSKTPEPQISKQQILNRCLRWELESNNLEGGRLFFNLTCLFLNLRGSVFISKQTPLQHFLQNIWSVIWPNIYTLENYFAGINYGWSISLLIFRIGYSVSFLTLLWWKQFVLHDLFFLSGDEIEVHNDVKCIFLSCGRICMVQVVCKAIHWSIMLEKVCSQCLTRSGLIFSN